MATNDNNIENKIIETAQQLFVKNGFTDTNMSDIAAAVGINRPTLHYYFRTKDKMFQAVFGNIILSLAPDIHSKGNRTGYATFDQYGSCIGTGTLFS